jgi:hypothetical protein
MKRVLSLFAVLLLCSCALIPLRYERLYTGPAQPRERVAMVTHRNPYSQQVFIVRIDGRDVEAPGMVELLPGRHVLEIGYATMVGSTCFQATVPKCLELQAEGGHTYVIYAEDNIRKTTMVQYMDWWPILQDVTDQLDEPQWRRVKSAVDKYWIKMHG